MTFEEVVDFLVEFNVVANGKICTERQITILVQGSFPNVIIKPNSKHRVTYFNLENRSDEVIKEELVRVTTEPIIPNQTATVEAKHWIEEECNGAVSEEEDDKELSRIENKKEQQQNIYKTESLMNNSQPYDNGNKTYQSEFAKSQNQNMLQGKIEEVTVERGVDVPSYLPQAIVSTNQQNKENCYSPLAYRKHSSPALPNSYSPLAYRKHSSPGIPIKRTPSFGKSNSLNRPSSRTSDENSRCDSPSKSNLRRNRSFSKSSEQFTAKSIREKFQLQNTEKQEIEPTKKSKESERTTKKSGIVSPRLSSSDIPTRPSSAADVRNSTPVNSTRKSVSNGDLRGSFNKQERRAVARSNSKNGSDFKSNSRKLVKRNSFRKDEAKNSFSRNTASSGENRGSYRLPSKDNTLYRNASERSSLRGTPSECKEKSQSLYKSQKESKPVKRRASLKKKRKPTENSSSSPSNPSTPDTSFETTNLKDEVNGQQERDFVRIAKAFQKASHKVDETKDNIEKFMVSIATVDLTQCLDYHLKLDDLYEHIRERMIRSKDQIFEGCRSEVTVEMNQYFTFLFQVLASHFDNVGCEMVTDPVTREKNCFLTHVRLNEYTSYLESIRETDSEETGNASYV